MMTDKRVVVEKDNFGNIITGDSNTIINNSDNSLSSFGHALYYPNIHLTDEKWLKHAFLFWDKISRIVPHSFEPQDNENVSRIKKETNFLEDYHPEKWIVRDTFKSFSESIEIQIDTKIEDIKKMRLNEYHKFYRKNELATMRNCTYIHIEKLDEDLIERLYYLGLARPGENRWSSWIKIDNEIGQLYMSYLAKTISNEKSIPMVTDTEDSYSSQNVYQERRYANQFKEELGYLLIDMVVPKDINNIAMKQLIEFKTKYNDQRMQFFHEINKLSSSIRSLDSKSELEDALHYHKVLLTKQTKEQEKIFNLNGIETIKNPLVFSMGASLVTDNLWTISAGLAYGAFLSYTEYIKRNDEVNQHPMSYLLNIKSELNKEGLFQKIKRNKSYL